MPQWEGVITVTTIDEQQVTLESVSRKILGDYYFDEIKRFLEPHLSDNEKCYTLFLTRRCSCLADIYLRILNRPAFQRNQLLTNSAFINAAQYIGTKLKKGDYDTCDKPFMFMVDDSISFGRASASVLSEFKSQLIKYAETTEKQIEDFLRKFLRIRVYMKKEQRDLLSPFQRSLTEVVRVESQAKWNDFSTRVSELISNADVANAAFVYSVGTNSLPKNENDVWQQIETTYQGHKQHTFFKAFPDEQHPEAICSIRYIPCSVTTKYRAVPFFFLPNLNEQQISSLEKPIFKRLKALDSKFSDERYAEYSQNYTLRFRAEFITMYLGQMILMDFADSFHPNLSFDLKYYDSLKVNWTYTFFGNLECWNYSFPDILVRARSNPSEYDRQNNPNDIFEILSKTLIVESKGSSDKAPNTKDDKQIQYTFGGNKFGVSSEEGAEYGSKIADYLFGLAVRYEKTTKDVISQSRYIIESQSNGCDSMRRISVSRFLSSLSEAVSGALGLIQLLAFTLQMMDAGLMSVVTRIDDEEEMPICQQIRICEQALCVMPRELYAHIDVLNDLSYGYDWADTEIYKMVINVRFKPILQNYIAQLQQKNIIEIQNSEKLLERLCHFLLCLKKCYQNVGNWTLGIIRRFYIIENKENSFTLAFFTGSDDNNNPQWNQRHQCFKVYLSVI